MRLVRFNEGRIGVLQGDKVHDASAAIGLDLAAWPPVGMIQLIRNFAALRSKLEQAARSPGLALADVTLLAPVVWPHNLFAYPVNYIAHQTEMASTHRADLNGYFLKATSSISGPNDAIVLPDLPSREIHHECELALVIGKGGRHIPVADATDHLFGYSCLIDVTVRGKEERVMRKSYDTFTPLGPALVTADEVGDPGNLDMKLWVNEELRQHASTRDLIVDIPNMIALASSVSTLEPGDVIATGTPEGVGPIRDGDEVTIEIERVGRMTVRQGSGGENLAWRKETRQ
jgi:2-keto-4-pentenoate hydratase/2-oxohepta-3-ene-1,7-dioic acid hydratase in catechol pathway